MLNDKAADAQMYKARQKRRQTESPNKTYVQPLAVLENSSEVIEIK